MCHGGRLFPREQLSLHPVGIDLSTLEAGLLQDRAEDVRVAPALSGPREGVRRAECGPKFRVLAVTLQAREVRRGDCKSAGLRHAAQSPAQVKERPPTAVALYVANLTRQRRATDRDLRAALRAVLGPTVAELWAIAQCRRRRG
jgi:hypothetical protein